MITEDYISYEVAKLLKEKGFEGACDYAYSNKGNYFETDRSNFDEVYCLRPTHQMAMKWLREEKYVPIFIVPAKDENGNLTYCADVWTWNDDEGIYEPTWAYANNIYKEAVEAALKYSLENLI